MLGSLIIYLKGMRRMIFQLSGFYYKVTMPVTGGLLARGCALEGEKGLGCEA